MKDILIVEDSAKDRERLGKLFSDEGYSVVSCDTVTQAEKCLEHERFRLAMLDIGLSDKSGSYLFNTIKNTDKVAFIIIFTGNPSMHLKQRFLDEGAADYIVKASPQSQSDNLLSRVKDIIGAARPEKVVGIDLEQFLSHYVPESSRKLFLDMDNSFPQCRKCSGRQYVVTFAQKPQVPPEINGEVVCADCGTAMDPEVE